MSEPTPTPDPNLPPQDASNPAAPVPTPPVRKRRHVWPFVVGGVVVVLLLLLLLAPTIASTGLVRSVVVSKVNSGFINGTVEIQDWSVGWTSGIKVDGVRLKDANGVQVAELGELSTQLSLLSAIRGNYALGDTVIREGNFNIVRNPDGTNNLTNLFKPSDSKKSTSSKIPDVSGDIKLEKCRATYTDHARHQVVELTGLDGEVKIPDINQPVEDHLTFVAKVNGGSPGTLKLDGAVAAVHNNEVDAQGASGDQTATLQGFDVGVLTPVMQAADVDLATAGRADGAMKVTIKTLDDLAADGTVTVSDLRAAGKALDGDTYKTPSLALAVRNFSRRSGTDGKSHALKGGVNLTADQFNLAADVDAPQEALLQSIDLIKSAATAGGASSQAVALAGGSGTANAELHADVAKLTMQLPHVVKLIPGTTVQSGKLDFTAALKFTPDHAEVATRTGLTGVAAVRGGQSVSPGDVTASFDVNAVGGAKPDLTKLAAVVTSEFMTLNAGGDSLSNLSFDSHLDLAKFQARLGSIFDVDQLFHAPAGNHVTLAGDVTMKGGVQGNVVGPTQPSQPAGPGGPLNAWAEARVNNLTVSGLSANPVKLTGLYAGAGAQVLRAAGTSVSQAKDAWVRVSGWSDDPKKPWVNLDTAANVTFRQTPGAAGEKPSTSVNNADFNIKACDVDLARTQTQLAPVLALLASKGEPTTKPSVMDELADKSMSFDSGTIKMAGAGTYDGKNVVLPAASPFSLNVDQLKLRRVEPGAADAPAGQVQRLIVLANQVAVAFAGSYDGTRFHIDEARQLSANVDGIDVKRRTGAMQTTILAEQWMKVAAGGDVTLAPDGTSVNVPALSVTTADKLFDLTTDGPLAVSLAKGGAARRHGQDPPRRQPGVADERAERALAPQGRSRRQSRRATRVSPTRVRDADARGRSPGHHHARQGHVRRHLHPLRRRQGHEHRRRPHRLGPRRHAGDGRRAAPGPPGRTSQDSHRPLRPAVPRPGHRHGASRQRVRQRRRQGPVPQARQRWQDDRRVRHAPEHHRHPHAGQPRQGVGPDEVDAVRPRPRRCPPRRPPPARRCWLRKPFPPRVRRPPPRRRPRSTSPPARSTGPSPSSATPASPTSRKTCGSPTWRCSGTPARP